MDKKRAIKIKQKLILKEYETCNKTFNPKEAGATEILCESCKTKIKLEARKKDNLRKSLNRDDMISSNLEKLGDICE